MVVALLRRDVVGTGTYSMSGRFYTPLNLPLQGRSGRSAGATTTRAGRCRMSVGTARSMNARGSCSGSPGRVWIRETTACGRRPDCSLPSSAPTADGRSFRRWRRVYASGQALVALLQVGAVRSSDSSVPSRRRLPARLTTRGRVVVTWSPARWRSSRISRAGFHMVPTSGCRWPQATGQRWL